MTASRSGSSVRYAYRLSTGHGMVRSDIRLPLHIVGQLLQFDAIRRAFVSGFSATRLVATAPSKSTDPPAAPNSP
jgi:hypothetical protein